MLIFLFRCTKEMGGLFADAHKPELAETDADAKKELINVFTFLF